MHLIYRYCLIICFDSYTAMWRSQGEVTGVRSHLPLLSYGPTVDSNCNIMCLTTIYKKKTFCQVSEGSSLDRETVFRSESPIHFVPLYVYEGTFKARKNQSKAYRRVRSRACEGPFQAFKYEAEMFFFSLV